MKKNLKFLFVIMMAGLFGILMNFNVFAAQKETRTLTVTIERFVLGGSYIVEPTIVEFTPGETYADILEKVLTKNNLTWKYNNSYGYYLEGINGVDCGTENVPQCVRELLADIDIPNVSLEIGKNYIDGLYEYSYTEGSGWMYYVNNEYVPVGMSNIAPEGGEVVRYMFTLCYGADLTGTLDKSMTKDGKSKTYYQVADKTDLIRYIAQINQDKARWQKMEGFSDSYNDAIDILATIDASQWDVNDILSELERYFPKSLKLNKNTLSLEIGKTAKLSYSFLPEGSSTTVNWSSDNGAVATVKNGVITGVKKGTTKIHATTVNGLDEVCSVTVKEPKEMTTFKTGTPSVSVKSVSYNSVKVSWNAYKNATGYDVYRKTSNGSWKKLKSLVTGTSYTDKTVATGTNYYYRVRAKSSKWTGTAYSKYGTSKKIATKLGQVTLKSVSAGKKCATVKWSKVSGATGYKVYRAKSQKGKYTCIRTVGNKVTSYKNTKLTKGKTYYYKVRAYRTVNKKPVYGAYSKVKSAKAK